MAGIFCEVIAHEIALTLIQHCPVACLHLCGVASALFLLLHLRLETFFIDCHATFAANQFGQVEREAKGIK